MQLYFALVSFVLSWIIVFILIKLGVKYHFYDEVRNDGLKIHKKPVVYLGGVGIFLAIVIVLAGGAITNSISWYQTLGIILSSAITVILGLLDDWKWKKEESKPILKLFFQVAAVFLVFFILIKTNIITGLFSNLSFDFFVITFYLTGSMNALNMEDGIDGLAGGITAISLIGFSVVSLSVQNYFAFFFTFSLFGAILGFLYYNWNPASVFMGDSGSHFLGFSLAVLALIFTLNPFTDLSKFIAPILIIGLPIIDVAITITRRILNGKSPFFGDREHLYDKLFAKLADTKRTVLIYWLIQAIIVWLGVTIYLL